MDQNCRKRLSLVRITGQLINPELAAIEEGVFPVDLGSRLQGVEDEVIRTAACDCKQ
jgi:hypothetical protein